MRKKAFRLEVNHLDDDNTRIHEQCEQMFKLVDDEQISLIVLGEYTTLKDGIRCKATSVVHTDAEHGNIALAAAIVEQMTQHDELRQIILGAAYLYEERQQYIAERN